MTLPTFNIPPIGPRSGKVWGITQLVFAHNSVECHRIEVKKGGYSSRHSHRSKWNRFLVMRGRLAVFIQLPDGSEDRTVLTHDQITDVPPGVVHGFEALEETEAIEIYWTVLDASDIERGDNKGGLKDESRSQSQ